MNASKGEDRQIYGLRVNRKPVLGSHVGKIVTGSLLAAAAAVGILSGLTTLVGLPVALGVMVVLIVIAIGVGFITRPKPQPTKSAEPRPRPPKARVEASGTPVPTIPTSSQLQSPAKTGTTGVTTSRLSPSAALPSSGSMKRLQVPPAPDRFLKNYSAAPKSAARLGAAYREGKLKAFTPPTPAPQQARFKETVLLRKQIDVEAGEVKSIKLDVAKGDLVYGQLKEVDEYEFTWAIVDLTGLGLMERRLRFPVQRGEMDVPTATVEWNVPSEGPWFLAFDAYKKQYLRQVSVVLWQRVHEPT